MTYRSKQKTKQRAPKDPRWDRCVWCEKPVNLNANDWVCDGHKEILHYDCFTERLGIINEDR